MPRSRPYIPFNAIPRIPNSRIDPNHSTPMGLRHRVRDNKIHKFDTLSLRLWAGCLSSWAYPKCLLESWLSWWSLHSSVTYVHHSRNESRILLKVYKIFCIHGSLARLNLNPFIEIMPTCKKEEKKSNTYKCFSKGSNYVSIISY